MENVLRGKQDDPGASTWLLSGLDYLAAFDLYGDLWKWAWGRSCYDLGAVGRVEDRAVARAGKLAALVGYRAALVRAYRRVSHKVAVLQVDQNRRVSRVLERDGAARCDLGLARDGSPPSLGLAA